MTTLPTFTDGEVITARKFNRVPEAFRVARAARPSCLLGAAILQKWQHPRDLWINFDTVIHDNAGFTQSGTEDRIMIPETAVYTIGMAVFVQRPSGHMLRPWLREENPGRGLLPLSSVNCHGSARSGTPCNYTGVFEKGRSVRFLMQGFGSDHTGVNLEHNADAFGVSAWAFKVANA